MDNTGDVGDSVGFPTFCLAGAVVDLTLCFAGCGSAEIGGSGWLAVGGFTCSVASSFTILAV